MTHTYLAGDAEERARRVELILMDVDGVMTDGQILIMPDARGVTHEYKMFNTRDGFGLSIARRAGLRLGILSGRVSDSVSTRAAELGMEIVEQGSLDKLATYHKIRAHTRFDDVQIAFMGDDVQDLPVLRHTGFAVAVADAHPDVKSACQLVTTAEGGHGAVREALEFILRAQGKWGHAMAPYLQQG